MAIPTATRTPPKRGTLLLLAVLGLPMVGFAGPAPAPRAQTPRSPAAGAPAEAMRSPSDPESALRTRLSKGRLAYRIHCASCHGETGKGDGAMVDVLKIRPADLTRLAASHDGVFPRDEVFEAIDGRRTIAGHGPGGMPVWGLSFQVPGTDVPQEREIEEKILDLLAWLEIIQEKDAG